MGHHMRCLSAAEHSSCIESLMISQSLSEVTTFGKVVVLKPNTVHGGWD